MLVVTTECRYVRTCYHKPYSSVSCSRQMYPAGYLQDILQVSLRTNPTVQSVSCSSRQLNTLWRNAGQTVWLLHEACCPACRPRRWLGFCRPGPERMHDDGPQRAAENSREQQRAAEGGRHQLRAAESNSGRWRVKQATARTGRVAG